MTIEDPKEQWFSPPQLARALNCSAEHIIGLIARKELKATNISLGRRARWKIALSDFEAMLDRRSNQKPAPKTKTRRGSSSVPKYV